MTDRIQAAQDYLKRGLVPIPIPAGQKGPRLPGWQKLRPREADLSILFGSAGNIGLLLGEPSGGLIDVDLDCEEARELADQFLPPTPAVTGRPSAPGSHRWYFADVETKKHADPVDKTMIVELRGTGCQTVVGPSIHPSGEPYDVLNAEPARVSGPMLAACVEALAKAVVKARHGEQSPPERRPQAAEVRPCGEPLAQGEQDVERRAIAYLAALPPAISGSGGHPATYTAATALVHGFGLEPDRAFHLLLSEYNPRCQPEWSERELRHKVEDAAKREHDRPYGWLRDTPAAPAEEYPDVDLSQFRLCKSEPEPEEPDRPDDPGPIPDDLMRVPGFVGDVMEFCRQSARYPSVPLAFCGAMALQSYLCSRKVREEGGLRPNLYMLALAGSGHGKAYPRKINSHILGQIGLAAAVGNQIASGQGLEDEMFVHRKMLYQTDEVDNMLRSLSSSKEAYHSMLLAMLLQLYTEADETHAMRTKARAKGQGEEIRGEIDQPGLVIFGTATPECFFQAMSPKLLTNGLFSRSIIVDVGKRGRKQRPRDVGAMPERLIEVAEWWRDYNPEPVHPTTGRKPDLGDEHPTPAVVPYEGEGFAVLDELGTQADDEYDAAMAGGDRVRAILWTRVCENATRLALVYACSRAHENPRIDREAAEWASRFARHLADRMLFLASSHVAENPFHAECLKVLEKLRSAGGELPHSVLMKRMKVNARDFQQIVETLMQQNDIEPDVKATKGRTRTVYRLCRVKEG